MIYIIKPIVWNSNNYKFPSGAKFTSGFPKDNGFGHEEWNNSDSNIYEDNKRKFVVFHTEDLKKKTEGDPPDIEKYAGKVCMFMIASFEARQYLVGIAEKSTYIYREEDREKLVNRLRINDRWEQAWAVEQVRICYKNNKREFLKGWNKDVNWIPNWKCPLESFKWFDEPVLLNPEDITGKKKLVAMYNGYQQISYDVAKKFLILFHKTKVL